MKIHRQADVKMVHEEANTESGSPQGFLKAASNPQAQAECLFLELRSAIRMDLLLLIFVDLLRASKMLRKISRRGQEVKLESRWCIVYAGRRCCT